MTLLKPGGPLPPFPPGPGWPRPPIPKLPVAAYGMPRGSSLVVFRFQGAFAAVLTSECGRDLSGQHSSITEAIQIVRLQAALNDANMRRSA